ncbi:hypothetical protein [Leifsonia sp. PS1209]|uniref:hypothetical protein n=1 Tax=Leifsonia sp. PS1209 TaxID=2724914 RepID=UPI001442D13C|nr:hypothetical protein [Leifsonia sp. PS1209]QIZ98728.1 hypothetical protein HF024_09595 [Leifsonia sp. PS1209]
MIEGASPWGAAGAGLFAAARLLRVADGTFAAAGFAVAGFAVAGFAVAGFAVADFAAAGFAAAEAFAPVAGLADEARGVVVFEAGVGGVTVDGVVGSGAPAARAVVFGVVARGARGARLAGAGVVASGGVGWSPSAGGSGVLIFSSRCREHQHSALGSAFQAR